ncbi:MAG: hypothetical protein QOG68_2503 [Solirubrobacteraceae bacterium]|jgi:hypothetical protein|nr:hypothetical protein [Solirubrobacteraceae bacterium]
MPEPGYRRGVLRFRLRPALALTAMIVVQVLWLLALGYVAVAAIR